MNVLIIGASGYIGTAVDSALRARGHHLAGTARGGTARQKLRARGTDVVYADPRTPETTIAAIRAADAVVYAMHVADADPFHIERGMFRVIRRTLAGTEKTFVFISAAWVYGNTGSREATEDAQLDPPPFAARCLELERATLAMTKLGVRALIVRPGIAYGRGGGIPAMLANSAHDHGAASIGGDGRNRWATIDVDDLGTLIALAVERGRPGRAYNAVNDDRFALGVIVAAARHGTETGGASKSGRSDFAVRFGDCLALDQMVSAERAKRDLEWIPTAPSIVQDLEAGSYRPEALAG